MTPTAPDRLKRRADFVRLSRRGRKWAGRAVVIQMAHTPAEPEDAPTGRTRVGYTASRKVGGAVVRNRAKRRLRAIARDVIDQRHPDTDIVLIARRETATCPFEQLRREVEAGVVALSGGADKAARPAARQARR